LTPSSCGGAAIEVVIVGVPFDASAIVEDEPGGRMWLIPNVGDGGTAALAPVAALAEAVGPAAEDAPATIRNETGHEMMPMTTANTNAVITSHRVSPRVGAALVGMSHSSAVVFGRKHWRVNEVSSTVVPLPARQCAESSPFQ
jgi:hypothetical protein